MRRMIVAGGILCGSLILASTALPRGAGITEAATPAVQEQLPLHCHPVGNPDPPQAKVEGKYVGAETCKNCHKSKEMGEGYTKWKDSKHAKAFDTLAGDEAKKIAKEKGIDDPQKSEKCVKCHVTAYGVNAAQLGPKFDSKQGVQCETCHGPGEKHVKARMMAEEGEGVKPGEIGRPDEKTCTGCHNQESPKYKEFKFDERKKQIEHPIPNRKKK